MTASRQPIGASSTARLDHASTPPGYVAWTAADKHHWLWHTLIARSAHRPETLPPLTMPFTRRPIRELGVVLRKHELDSVLSRTEDMMEIGRPKVIHARGSVAMVRLETVPTSPFSGLLGPAPAGGAVGLLRMSLVARVNETAAFTPGIGVKFLIDGAPSADILAMNHTVGQGRDFDVFSNTMTNDLSEEHRELRTPQRVMSVLFDRVSRRPRRLISDHLCERTADGGEVAEPSSPVRLVFHPTDEARAVFAGQAGVDFRLVLAELEPGTPLYRVEGRTRDGAVDIGTLRATTTFVSSDGGDRLFFRHVQEQRDQRLRS